MSIIDFCQLFIFFPIFRRDKRIPKDLKRKQQYVSWHSVVKGQIFYVSLKQKNIRFATQIFDARTNILRNRGKDLNSIYKPNTAKINSKYLIFYNPCSGNLQMGQVICVNDAHKVSFGNLVLIFSKFGIF